ncbi:MAG: hypothetical protein KGJ06_06885 [Pseudomonadota bacterium]|nr:hypothetical protein [Pseudomonadota bacterium]
MIDLHPKSPHRYVCSVDAFVLQGPNPIRSDHEDEHNWLIGVDIGLTKGHRGFWLRKELAYELVRLIRAKLPEAGLVEKKFVHHDYGMEHLYIIIDKHKNNGTEVNAPELKEFVKQMIDTVNAKHFAGMHPILTFTEKTWADILHAILQPEHARGWSVE